MFRRDKWWHREIERIRREHAAREAELIATICTLAGKPHASTLHDTVVEVEEDDPDADLIRPEFH